MKIEVAVPPKAATKVKGDLLENIAKKLLEAQNYEVEEEVRNTGVEVDLLCRSKTNNNKKISVECKAYRDKKIDSGIIDKMLGVKSRKKYAEAWLITTSSLGKDAKGIMEELLEEGNCDVHIFTPEKLMLALIDTNVIVSIDIPKSKVLKNYSENQIFDEVLLVTPKGYFWAFATSNTGKAESVLLFDATNGQMIVQHELLYEVQTLDSSLTNLEFPSEVGISNTNNNEEPYKLNHDYYLKTLDTGVKYTHPDKNIINVDDIFIYQDLQVLNEDKEINSSKIIVNDKEKHRLFIFGNELSGKTTLAYNIQRKIIKNGLIPVYINAAGISSSDNKRIEKLVKRKITEQYENSITINSDKNIDEKIVLIIDDFHTIKTNNGSTVKVINILNEKYSKIIFFSNSSRELKLLIDNDLNDALSNYDFYKIKELGYKLRDEIIKKWVSIGRDETIGDNEKYTRTIELANTIDVTVGKNFVPTYPIYILTLLQSFEASSAKTLQGSAYAEFYNYLITQSLGSIGIKPTELHLYFSFLSELAYFFFDKSTKEISETELESFHVKYCENKMINSNFDRLRNNLLKSKILKEEIGSFSFNHNYIYYFFAAKNLSDHIDDENIREQVKKITQRLYRTEFANIIIFLVHFTKNKLVLNGIIDQAKSTFSEINIATFSKEEFENINKLINQEINIFIEEKKVEESRAEQLTLKDKNQGNETNEHNDPAIKYDEDIKQLDIFGKINLSFKLMEILGQIAKNYYGSLDGPLKVELIEETYNLGLRSLNCLMQGFNEYTDVIEEHVQEAIEKNGYASKDDIILLRKKIVFNFASMISLSFIEKAANSVASKDLTNIFKKVYEDDPQIGKRLINTAIELDFPNGLSSNSIADFNKDLKGNNLALMLLKLFVTRHLYKFNVKYDVRQRVCEELSIGLEKQKNILSNQQKQLSSSSKH